MLLPCGQCLRCRLERSRQWAMRCMHEASSWKENCFITLTYSDENIPSGGNLRYKDYQDFMKRLRYYCGENIRFYMSGEYGESTRRPHYHACLFNHNFDDRSFWRKSDAGFDLDRSVSLEKLWPYGHSEIGAVSFESAAYCARYICDKLTGERVVQRVDCRIDTETGEVLPAVAEFSHMSLKNGGIGAPWLERFFLDVYRFDHVIVNGKEMKPPKYYDRWYEKRFPESWELIYNQRVLDGRELALDNTPARRVAKEAVARAGLSFFSRNLS